MARSSKTTKSNKKGVYPAQLKGKGFDAHPEHINRAGRIPPKDVRELNDLIDEILAEEISDANGVKIQKIRVLLNKLILSKTPVGQIHILDRRFGKVPDKIDVTSAGEKLGTDATTIDRAISTLADALREIVPGKSTE